MNIEQIMNYGNDIFVDGLVNFTINTFGILILTFLVKKIFVKYLKKFVLSETSPSSFYIKTLKTILYIVATFIILSGIKPLKSLGSIALSASSLIAVIVGIASQETLGNFVSGFILSIYQPFKIGDVITLKDKNFSGTVTNVGFRHTTIRTIENTNIIVPNSVMNTTIIENKKSDIQSYRNTLFFNIGYDADVDLAKEIMAKNALIHPLLIDSRDSKGIADDLPIINIHCTGLKEYSIELRLVFYTIDYGAGFEMCSDLRQSILNEFKENGITIALPTRLVKQM